MIDDVAYLKANALQDSQIVYIDSSTRDRRVFPDPAQYTIDFDQPYRNVYGFDILDASLPATGYNVEPYASTLYFSTVTRRPNSLTLPDPALGFEEVRRCPSFVRMFAKHASDAFALVSETSPSLTALLDADVTSPALALDPDASASHPHRIYVREQVTLTPDRVRALTIQSLDTHYAFEYDGVRYAIDQTQPGNAALIARLQSAEFSLVFQDGVAPDPRRPRIVIGAVFFDAALVSPATYSAARASGLYELEIANLVRSLEPGTYDVLTLINDLNDLLNPSTLEVEATTPIPRKQGKLVFSSSSYFAFDADRGDLVKALGFGVYPYAIRAPDRHAPVTVGDNDFVYGAVSSGGRYRLFAPGLVSLLGERFLILRIPEIETHLYGSFAYNRFTPGVGMFKNAASFGAITNLRFDFVTAPRKPFHPIGKLSRLTVRFETPSGQLYDFKGVNHQIMAQIKFYVPYRDRMEFKGSLLNPEYDPDVRVYMTSKKTIEQREDSGDEEDFVEDEQAVAAYKADMDRFMVDEYENDEEEDEYEDEQEEEEEDYTLEEEDANVPSY